MDSNRNKNKGVILNSTFISDSKKEGGIECTIGFYHGVNRGGNFIITSIDNPNTNFDNIDELTIKEKTKHINAMKLWIARNKQGYIGLYYKKPTWKKYLSRIRNICYQAEDWSGDLLCYLNRNEFPEVTFENSPQEVEIKLIK